MLEIYAPYVEKTAVTFEYEVPAVTEFEKRIDHVLEKYPYLVAERAGDISGYAYAGMFKDRAAYRWAVETTVYVREDMKKWEQEGNCMQLWKRFSPCRIF